MAIWTFPATEVGARRRIMYLLGLVREVSAASGLLGACGVVLVELAVVRRGGCPSQRLGKTWVGRFNLKDRRF